jgi:diguanylate cyclase (GGDEF)-like protein/PAS domain S-box-containing protein
MAARPERSSIWRSPLVVASVVLCLLAGVVLWQAEATSRDHRAQQARVIALEREADERARRAGRGPGATLNAARSRERELAHRQNVLTWLLGGLMLAGAALMLALAARRRGDDDGRALRDERRVQALAQHATEMIVVLDRRGTIVTQTGQDIVGHGEDGLLGRTLRDLLHPDDRPRLSALLAGRLDISTVEWRLRHADGRWIHVESAVADMRDDPDVAGIIFTSRDVTERKVSEAQLRHRAFHDPLTQLPNRALFYDRIEHAQHRARREGQLVAVCMLDLDDFKSVNDTHGHAAGDELLVAVAQRLRGCLRSGDTAARLGGDEFGILVEGIGEPSEAIQVAERVLAAMRQPFEAAGEQMHVGPSVGVAIAASGDEPVEDLVRHADVAMYAAKRHGKGRYEVYDAALAAASEEGDGTSEAEVHRPLTWLRRAEEQRAEVLSLLEGSSGVHALFQPLLDLRTGGIAGFESLARFGSAPERPPNVWFAQAQRAGLGARLEAAALRAALAAPGRPDAAFLSVNVSPSTLPSAEVRDALPEDLSSVVVEITENELVAAGPAVHQTLEELRERGARIAVDDAGSGYAGFTQLLRVRPDIIKLDRDLCDGVAADDYRAALISSFVGFARSIGALVCAEGIETLDDLRALADLDVTYGQGYVLAPPGRPWPEVSAAAVAVCYEAWQSALHGRALGDGRSPEAALSRVAARIAAVRSAEEIPGALDAAARDLRAERAALRRVMPDGTLVTVGGMPLTAGRRIDDKRPEFADAAGRLLVVPVEQGGQTVGILELLAPERQPWHRSEIHRARVLAQLFAPVLSGAAMLRLSAA